MFLYDNQSEYLCDDLYDEELNNAYVMCLSDRDSWKWMRISNFEINIKDPIMGFAEKYNNIIIEWSSFYYNKEIFIHCPTPFDGFMKIGEENTLERFKSKMMINACSNYFKFYHMELENNKLIVNIIAITYLDNVAISENHVDNVTACFLPIHFKICFTGVHDE